MIMENNEKASGKQGREEQDVRLAWPVCTEKKEMVVCDVCGYANPKYTALCKQCSNYLTNK
jgi:hypothetical protein